ncbi:MAG TPA: hypothetical protein VFC21_02555 [Bryobacteraceae bacterium]|nr:hypothetical protein [Bryobacteraceae bacterium]
MTLRAVLTAAAVLLAGCGYPGEPLPPALNRPIRVSDLSVIQKGSKIVIHFTVPKLTTEGLPIRDNPDIEIRIGPAPPGGWSLPAWEKTSERIPAREIAVDNQSATAVIDASNMYGRTEVIGARIHGPHGRDVGWSNQPNLLLVPALPTPEGLAAANAPDAVRLDWHAAAAQFRVYRRTPGNPEWTQLGTSDKPFYVDSAIDYGKTYEYMAQSIEKSADSYAQSDDSAIVSFKPEDKYAPAVPAGVTAVPGARTIEIVWERNVEKDFASYRVYRDGKQVADGLTSPSYSDRDVKAGTKYSYRVSAADRTGNRSALSAAVEAAIP